MARYRSYEELDDTPVGETESALRGFNNRLRPDQLPMGILAESLNGRLDIGGEWQTRKGIQVRLAPFASAAFTLPFYLYANVNSNSLSGATAAVITINFAAPHGIVDQTLVNVSGITGVTPDPNGNRVATVTTTTALTITVAGSTGTAAGTATVGAPKIDDTAVNAVYGAMAFYDDANDNADYILIAGNTELIAFNLDTDATTTIAYPSGVTISTDVEIKQFNNKVYIWRDGLVSLEWDGDLGGGLAFTEVANGAYTQPVALSSTTFSVTNNVATITTSTPSTHGLSVGDVIVLTDEGSSGLFVDSEWVVKEVVSSSVVNFFARVANQASISDTEWTAQVSQGLGFSHLPAPPWGVVHQKRLVVPYNYTMEGTSGSPTITDREVRDELIFSLLSSSDTFDYIYGQFKFLSGKSDYIVGVHSFSDDQLVVFNRESIYVISNSLDLKTAQVNLLTNDLGCVARSTIQQVGNKLMFLSDNGVYGLDFQDLYNLRGQDVPLSESINSSIQRINPDYVNLAQGVYFDNRYYLAAPIDGSTTSNAMFVFNFLNKEWESIDSVGDTNWNYRYVLIAGDGSDRGVYVVNRNGGVHRIDVNDAGNDTIITQIGGTQNAPLIAGSATSRMVTGGDMGRKKWKSWELHVESSAGANSDATLTAITENIDGTTEIGSISSLHGSLLSQSEDISLRGRLGNPRAYGIQLKVDTTQGRPKIRAIKFNGAKTFRSTTEAI
tara:strand:+ start:2777 stop:4951 length:2175 start_codon:yes stop_codon:yes gene_type:complete